MPEDVGFAVVLWGVFGFVATAIFYSRFYVQWIVSEIQRKSVVPEAFWYQSAIGSLMLLVWSFYVQSPLGALSHCLNVVPYTRNLVHIWREKGRLTRSIDILATAGSIVIALAAITVVFLVWQREYAINKEAPEDVARTAWIWLAIGVVGQVLFGCRFLIQWVLTEWHRKSIVPKVFWQLSFIAASLQIATFIQRQEWNFIVGTAATLVIYARNLWFIHMDRADAVLTEKG